MRETAEFAGHFAAHAIWCLADGGPLVPMYCYEMPDGSRLFDRLFVDDSIQAMDIGQSRFDRNAEQASRAALVVDATINNNGSRMDALIIDARSFVDPEGMFSIVVPYAGVDARTGFGVYPAVLNQISGFDAQYVREVLEPFFVGVDSHTQGSEVWNANLIGSDDE